MDACQYCGAITTRAPHLPAWTACMACNLRARIRHHADEPDHWNWLFIWRLKIAALVRKGVRVA